jgi:hypothetical protein
MPADPPLTDDERRVLDVLTQSKRPVAERTVEAIAGSLGTTFTPVHRVLRRLEERRPQLAHPQMDEGLNVQFWIATSDAAEAVEGD